MRFASATFKETKAQRSPMSLTSPKTNLTRGHYAPVSLRSLLAPHPTMPRNASSFLTTFRGLRPAMRP